MDHLFKHTVLTAAVNMMLTNELNIFQRYFAARTHLEPSDRLQFDIIHGSQKILPNISAAAEATVTDVIGRTTVTMRAPRVAEKRFIATADLNAMRAWGAQGVEMMTSRIAREQFDMRGVADRTLEFWAASALKGKLLDDDMTTVLVDYNLAGTHDVTLVGDDLWTDTTDSNPINQIRAWKKLIGVDSGAAIKTWHAYCGDAVMDALLDHPAVVDKLQFARGPEMVEEGRIRTIAGVTIEEYNGTFLDRNGTRQRYIATDQFLLIGECLDLVDCPYAPIVDSTVSGGVGNVSGGQGQLFYAKSWTKEDPDGRWLKTETRPLPALQRPGAIVKAKVV